MQYHVPVCEQNDKGLRPSMIDGDLFVLISAGVRRCAFISDASGVWIVGGVLLFRAKIAKFYGLERHSFLVV